MCDYAHENMGPPFACWSRHRGTSFYPHKHQQRDWYFSWARVGSVTFCLTFTGSSLASFSFIVCVYIHLNFIGYSQRHKWVGVARHPPVHVLCGRAAASSSHLSISLGVSARVSGLFHQFYLCSPALSRVPSWSPVLVFGPTRRPDRSRGAG